MDFLSIYYWKVWSTNFSFSQTQIVEYLNSRDGFGVGRSSGEVGRVLTIKPPLFWTKKIKFWKDRRYGDTTLRNSFPDLCIIALTKDEGSHWNPCFSRHLNDIEMESSVMKDNHLGSLGH